MTDRSAIEWTQATWNPVTGCDRISPGCQHCYALTLAKRLKAMGQPKYQTDGRPPTSGPGFGVALHPQTLLEPLGWRRPRRIFVCSMADLFHARVPDAFIARVFAVMAATPQHTYQVLTKRPGRMARLLGTDAFPQAVLDRTAAAHGAANLTWPLPNVWLGTSVEDQQRANQRIPNLLAAPAVIRLLSCEPLLGPVDLGLAICRQTAPAYGRGLNQATVHLAGCCQRALRDGELPFGLDAQLADSLQELVQQVLSLRGRFFIGCRCGRSDQGGHWTKPPATGTPWSSSARVLGTST